VRHASDSPFRGFAPIPWSIETAIAFAVVHTSATVSPDATTDGEAVKVICGSPGAVIVTVAVAVRVLPVPVAVSV